jgi:hypothetical protein
MSVLPVKGSAQGLWEKLLSNLVSLCSLDAITATPGFDVANLQEDIHLT